MPVFSMVKARAEERSIPFAQAARELGLDFSEDDLKGLAADVGVDLAVSLTPVGVVKKAWDVLGNIDDIVAVTQLYGEAYPDNPVIQELAELATTVEGSETFKAYVYGRDALTGAVGGVIDGMLGDSGDEEETAEALAHLRASLQEGGAAQQAANSGATQAELAETLTFDLRQRMAAQQSLFAAEPTATADAPLTAPRPDAAALSGDTVLSDEKARSDVGHAGSAGIGAAPAAVLHARHGAVQPYVGGADGNSKDTAERATAGRRQSFPRCRTDGWRTFPSPGFRWCGCANKQRTFRPQDLLRHLQAPGPDARGGGAGGGGIPCACEGELCGHGRRHGSGAAACRAVVRLRLGPVGLRAGAGRHGAEAPGGKRSIPSLKAPGMTTSAAMWKPSWRPKASRRPGGI
ncbi:hypothetical protein QW131_15365 [Roseibium salinum]|nr:hypothetical protein [Roseibium salinum]